MSSLPPYDPNPVPPALGGSGYASGPPPQRNRGRGVLIAVVLGLCVTGMLVCCGGGIGLMNFGFSVMAVEVQDELAMTPEFQEHIGSIESFEMNWARSFADEDDDAFVYDIQGSNGSGYVRVEQYTDEFGREVIESAKLTLSDGRSIPVSIDP